MVTELVSRVSIWIKWHCFFRGLSEIGERVDDFGGFVCVFFFFFFLRFGLDYDWSE